MTISDLLKNGDSFEFLPGVHSRVLHVKKGADTVSHQINEVGELFAHRFKLYYDGNNKRFVASIVTNSKPKKFFGPNIDLVLASVSTWEKRQGN